MSCLGVVVYCHVAWCGLCASGLWISRLGAGQRSEPCCSATGSAQHMRLSVGTLSCTLGALCSVRNTASLHIRRLSVDSCVAAHAPSAGMTCDHCYRLQMQPRAVSSSWVTTEGGTHDKRSPPLVHVLKTAVGTPIRISARHTTTAETQEAPSLSKQQQLNCDTLCTTLPTHTALDGHPSKADTQKPQRVA